MQYSSIIKERLDKFCLIADKRTKKDKSIKVYYFTKQCQPITPHDEYCSTVNDKDKIQKADTLREAIKS